MMAERHWTLIVDCGLQVSTDLLSQRWDKIFYTGGADVGKIIYKTAAE